MKPFSISYSVYGKDYNVADLTEGEATKLLRNLVKNFYNRETGCTNGLLCHYGDIYVARNGRTVVQFSGGEFFSWKRGEGSLICNWDVIFSEKISKIA